jgi:hypothetical protein
MRKFSVILLGIAILTIFHIYAQNAPITTAGTKVSNGTSTTVPITAINFSNIGSCNLKLTYNPTIMAATSVTKGQGLGGQLSSNLTIPGVITLGWFTWPGVTLPNNSVIFNITFAKVTNGTSSLIWVDDGYSCAYADGNSVYLNDIPTSTYYINGSVTFQVTNAPVTTASDIITNPNTNVNVPIKVTGFNNIGVFSLTMHYALSVLTYQSFTNNSGFPGMAINGTIPGVIIATGLVPVGGSGITLANNATLLTLQFHFQGGSTELVWFDTGSSCEYADYPDYSPLYDSPASAFYINGSVSEGLTLGLKLYLEGPFQNGEMSTNLNVQNLIPLSQPYAGAPWNYNGLESVAEIPDNAVDWVLIDLRESAGDALTATSNKTVAKKAAFLMKDGTLKGIDGNQNLDFPIFIHHNLYAVIYHRNHLSLITSNEISILNGNGFYDFSSGENQVLGGNLGHKEISTGMWGMIAGDANSDGAVNNTDYQNFWKVNAGLKGYIKSDFSLDSQTDNKDKDDLWIENRGNNSQVPE